MEIPFRLDACREVYYPREDSLLLMDAVRRFAFGHTLDMGTGTGIQGIAAALKGCDVTFSDIYEPAVDCAKSNAESNGVSGKFVVSDMFSNIHSRFDTIIFNPPYVPSETKEYTALDGGRKGRELIARFLDEFGDHVNDKHVVLLLESSMNSYEKDVERLNAEVVGSSRFFFEEIVVLKF